MMLLNPAPTMFCASCGYSEIVQYQNCMEILVVKKKYEKAVIKYH